MGNQWLTCTMLKSTLMNKTLRTLLLFLFVFLMVVLFILGSIVDHTSTSSVSFVTTSWNTTTTTLPPPLLTDTSCKRLTFKRLRRPNSNDVTPPIYDFFLFHDELDLLEIRLYELYRYVTLFLIVEGRTTLSGKPKPVYLKENWHRFEAYHSKMRRFEVDLDTNPKSYWANEIKAREEGLRLALQNQTEYVERSTDLIERP
jgi:hypothetical protein